MSAGTRSTSSRIALKVAVTVGTTLAVLDAWLAILAWFAANPLTGGCAGGGLVLFAGIALLMIGFGILVMTTVGVLGVAFVWIRFHVGAGLAVAACVLVLWTLADTIPEMRRAAPLVRVLVDVLGLVPIGVVVLMLVVWASMMPTRAAKVIVPIAVATAAAPFAVPYAAGAVADLQALLVSPIVTTAITACR